MQSRYRENPEAEPYGVIGEGSIGRRNLVETPTYSGGATATA